MLRLMVHIFALQLSVEAIVCGRLLTKKWSDTTRIGQLKPGFERWMQPGWIFSFGKRIRPPGAVSWLYDVSKMVALLFVVEEFSRKPDCQQTVYISKIRPVILPYCWSHPTSIASLYYSIKYIVSEPTGAWSVTCLLSVWRCVVPWSWCVCG